LDAIVDEKPESETQVILNSKKKNSGDLNQNIDVADQENISKSDGPPLPFKEIEEVENLIPSSSRVQVSEEPNEPLKVDTKSLNPLPEKTGIFARTPRRLLDDDMLEQLEELLISSDMGVDTAVRITANLAEGRFGKKLSTADIKIALSQEIVRVMEPVARPLPIYEKTPQVILVVGVNGSGKTTTIGKLASQFKKLVSRLL
jgi:fused signal recognition particle receptor